MLQPTARIAREMLQGFSRFVAHLRFQKSFSVCCTDGVLQVPVSSLDAFLDVHKEIVPVVPIIPAQIRENPIWSQRFPTHIDHHIKHLLMFSQEMH